jgi:chromosome segregation protein
MGQQISHHQRRQDATDALKRLAAERAQIEEMMSGSAEDIKAASAAVMEIADQVVEIEERFRTNMEGQPAAAFTELRTALADARSRLVEARSHLDRLTRQAAECARRLTAIPQDMEGWRRRHAQATSEILADMSQQGEGENEP